MLPLRSFLIFPCKSNGVTLDGNTLADVDLRWPCPLCKLGLGAPESGVVDRINLGTEHDLKMEFVASEGWSISGVLGILDWAKVDCLR